MRKEILELNQILEDIGPNPWEKIPDIDLYIDQVLDYMKRQHPGLNQKETLTSSMVNNYAKQGLIPRAKGKKYNREHISSLTVICLLKQIISVGDTKAIINAMAKDDHYEDLYKTYLTLFSEQATNLMDDLSSCPQPEDIHQLILKMAINSYLYKFACQYLIDSLEDSKDHSKNESKDDAKEKK